MTVTECIKTILSKTEITQEQFSKELGYAGKSSVTTPLSRNDGMGMRVETLCRWVECLGWQIVIQSPDTDEELILDGESE